MQSADFYRPLDSGERDVAAIQAVTAGPKVTETIGQLERDGEFTEQLYVHGLGVQLGVGRQIEKAELSGVATLFENAVCLGEQLLRLQPFGFRNAALHAGREHVGVVEMYHLKSLVAEPRNPSSEFNEVRARMAMGQFTPSRSAQNLEVTAFYSCVFVEFG